MARGTAEAGLKCGGRAFLEWYGYNTDMQTPGAQVLRRPRAFGGDGMPTLAAFVVHNQVTGRNHYRYLFTPKHHGADESAAQWLPSMSLEEEFAIFNGADQNELFDADGRLYGVQPEGGDGLRHIGK